MSILNLRDDIVTVTAALVDIASESLHEQEIADEIFDALSQCGHLTVTRDGHTIVAATSFGLSERVILAGHVDTVPANDNAVARIDDTTLYGLGSCDMKGGVAIALTLAAELVNPVRDVTYVFYEAEEIAAEFNGLGRIARERPELIQGDFAILMEPSNALVEAGCQGTVRVEVRTSGQRAHSARSWMGHNAIHDLADVLMLITNNQPGSVVIDGLEYREGLNAVLVSGGVATNVIPDGATLTVNYRFAPDKTEEQAVDWLRRLFAGYDVVVTDSAPGALPGLSQSAVSGFIEHLGVEARPKFGWTDVAQFTTLGIPAVNYGPGDPSFAHRQDEHVPLEQLRTVHRQLKKWLSH